MIRKMAASAFLGVWAPEARMGNEVTYENMRAEPEFEIGYGTMDPAEMDAWMEFVVPFGNVPPDINDHWRDYFDLTGLHMAQEAHGLDLNPVADLSSGQELIDNF